jgi:uncharacterized protein YbaP (TraB family)
MTRLLRGLLALALGCAAALGAAAQDAGASACPPQAQAPTPAQVQAALRGARDRGALWRLTRDGREAWLFGTIHVGKLDWAMPGPRLRAALQASDTIALEIDVTDPQMLARSSAAMRAAAPALPPALAARLARRLDAACLPPALRPLLEAQHPVMRAVTLAVLEARWEGLDAGYAQEAALAGFGRAGQLRVVSLETPESQLAALIPGDEGEALKMIESSLEQLESGAVRRTIARLARAWERGDLDELAQYERWCDCVLDAADRRLMQRLLDERNPALAERIDALHREGRKVFAGIGVLHMVGPQGLPALLRARGFQVERVALQ